VYVYEYVNVKENVYGNGNESVTITDYLLPTAYRLQPFEDVYVYGDVNGNGCLPRARVSRHASLLDHCPLPSSFRNRGGKRSDA
jgi:hypothetical protein